MEEIKNEKYFATIQNMEEYGEELMKKVSEYNRFVNASGIYNRWTKSYRAYYNLDSAISNFGKSSIKERGERGELKLITINHYRNLLKHILVLVMSNRPALECISVNTDYKSLAETDLGNSLLEYYMRFAGLQQKLKEQFILCEIFGEGWIDTCWDRFKGKEKGVDPDTEKLWFEGDLEYKIYDPIRVIRDVHRFDHNHNWLISLDFENKWDRIAKYPELESKIRDLERERDNTTNFYSPMGNVSDSDDIPVFKFRHKKTASVPFGRYTEFSSDECIYMDGALEYKDIYLRRLCPENFLGTIWGYTPGFDLLPIQQAQNALHSIIVTNQLNFGVQNLQGPKGANINFRQLSSGLNYIEYNYKEGKIEPLNLTQTPVEIFNYLDILNSQGETISGIPGTTRGDPEKNLRSGNSLALVQSMAIQYNSELQENYVQNVEQVGNDTIDVLKEYATEPRIAVIAGKANRHLIKEFSKKDIENIHRVICNLTNPLSKTTAGRVQMAESMIQMGALKSTDQYIQLISTGKFESMTEGAKAELMEIKSENEMLANGEVPDAVATDDHALHTREHKSVLSTPGARQDTNITSSALAHIMQHIQLWKSTDPALLLMTGQQPPPPQMAGGMPPPQGGEQPQAGAGQEVAKVQGQDLNSLNTQLPSLPENPLTGKEFDVETGGL